jgi:histidinol-phosphate aminotransferase
VLIRETGPSGWLRVSAGTPDEMATFRSALTEVLALPTARPAPAPEADDD